MKNRFDIPILFIIFRRKDTALKVIEAIAKVKPKKLYISQDGPRNKAEEKEVLETRKAVLSKINWKCNLTVWTHKKNLGLKKHIPQAFDRFFEKEEMGIYLEDDTLPNEDFFYFQRELLKRYKDDKRIFSINGTNFYPDLSPKGREYFLTQMGSCWGMGIWKRSWRFYDRDLSDLNEFCYKKFKDWVFDKRYFVYLKTFLSAIKRGDLNTWDYQLAYTVFKKKMFFISPSVNLVSNMGINKKGSNLFFTSYNTDISKFRFHNYYNARLKYKKEDAERDLFYFNRLFKWFFPRIFLVDTYLRMPKSIKSFILRIASFLAC